MSVKLLVIVIIVLSAGTILVHIVQRKVVVSFATSFKFLTFNLKIRITTFNVYCLKKISEICG